MKCSGIKLTQYVDMSFRPKHDFYYYSIGPTVLTWSLFNTMTLPLALTDDHITIPNISHFFYYKVNYFRYLQQMKTI